MRFSAPALGVPVTEQREIPRLCQCVDNLSTAEALVDTYMRNPPWRIPRFPVVVHFWPDDGCAFRVKVRVSQVPRVEAELMRPDETDDE